MEFNIMRYFHILSLLLLTLSLSACQALKSTSNNSEPMTRLQGNLTQDNGQWLFKPCTMQDSYILKPSSALKDELNTLSANDPTGLFADLNGHIDNSKGYFTPTQRYRLQVEGFGCNDPDFARLLIRASGNEPFWSILQTPRGLIFNQPGESAVALPYIEEQLPDGRFHISTEANNQNLQLWITPQQCIDSMSGTVYHLTASLQWNQQTLNGCATFGALRN